MSDRSERSSEPEQPPTRARRALRWGLELVVLLAAISLANAWRTDDLPRGEVPEFTLRDMEGARFDSAMLEGKPTLLVFWAPWCGVCRAQSPNLSWVQRLAGERARVVSVAASYRTTAELRAYMSAHDVNYPVLLGNAEVVRRFGVSSFPTAFFIDESGKIVRAAVGYTTTVGLLWRVLWAR